MDDTAIPVSSANLLEMQDDLESVLATICNWLDCNKLPLNLNKSKFMVFGAPKQFICKFHGRKNRISL